MPKPKFICISEAPCAYCGKHYPIMFQQQKCHYQDPACWKEYRKRNSQRFNAKLKARRQANPKRAPKPVMEVVIDKPMAYGCTVMRHRYMYLYRRYPEDVQQTVAVALLAMGINPLEKVKADPRLVACAVNRELYRAAYDMGFHKTEDMGTPRISEAALPPEFSIGCQDWLRVWRAY